MSERVDLTVETDGERIDKFLAEHIDGLSRSSAQRLISDEQVMVNEKVILKSLKLAVGDTVVVSIPEPKVLDVKAENIPLDVLYEDEDLLVVNKPKGMVVHPAVGNYDGTLVNALLYHCKDSLSGINGVLRPGIVHRIDKDTSGLLIVAKNDFAHANLAEQIKEHSFKREYNAVVYGNIKEDSGTIDVPIGRSTKDRKKMAVVPEEKGRRAVTHFEVIAHYMGKQSAFSDIIAKLETGRTHQIRVHMAYRGHPVAGDVVYGPQKVITSLHGQCLHAGLIGFVHPRTGEYIELKAPLPDYYTYFLSTLDEVG